MVPLSKRDAVTRQVRAEPEMRALYAFVFEEPFDAAAAVTFPHQALLSAVATHNPTAFSVEVSELRKRRTSEASGWYENDSLVFLLLVGCYRFHVDPSFLEPILTARERNTNQTPKLVNEVFRELTRKDLGPESKFSFIKVTLLQLAGEGRPRGEAARRVYHELIQPNLLDQLTPFLQLLALRAYDLILTVREPQPVEDIEEVIRGVEKFKEMATIGQVIRMVWALPYKWIAGAVIVIMATVSFFIGFGNHAATTLQSTHFERPRSLAIIQRGDASFSELSVVASVARDAVARIPQAVAIELESSSLSAPASKFSLEASGALDVVAAHAWLVQRGDSGETLSLLPIQIFPRGARAFLDDAKKDSRVIFVLIYLNPKSLSAEKLGTGITFRVLD